ncbi:hypothetical protein KY326_04970 [Candidatus Woesearchaeota archaeon]|nr:hypothetical protein [Candidatus Woesearchaeota archaeon]
MEEQVVVGDLGECIIGHPLAFIKVFYVSEADGYFSWQLNPDLSRGDEIKKEAMAFPVDKEIVQQIVDEPHNWDLQPRTKEGFETNDIIEFNITGEFNGS